LIHEINKPQIQPISYRLVMADYALLLGSFLLVHFIKTGNGVPSSEEVLILVIITGFWLLASTWTKKFDKDQHYQNIYYAYSAFFKGGMLIAAMLSVLIYSFQLFEYSRLMVFGPVAVLLILEIPLSYILYLTQGNGNGRDIESVNQVYSVLSQEQLIVPKNGHVKLKTPVQKKLEMLYLTENPDLYDFVSRHIDLEKTEATATRVFSTHTLFNVQVLDSNSLQLFINLHQVNDFRRINAYFLEVHQKLITEGYFVGKKSTIESRKERIYQKYPKYMAKVIYLIDFICTRVAPKLPWTDKIYFALTNGRERVISKAELLGRLHFCGFKVIALEKIDENLYFIAQKAQMPSLDQNPSYGPFIQLERIGYDGKIIRVNKLRTMYPYSEYIQDFVFDQNNLDEKGKLKDDFRVTEWGRVFRKLWLDELPQVVNFIRGDLGLVGVRALSRHYFGLYPKEVQQLRIQTKPGLLPPYYADMPKSFDEIVESERRYLIEKQKHPLSTDFKYFFKAVYNIVFKKARSM
jgi:lipopolysaccharide/colanic/teichoic acid biosynthesis glycosyltransferase